MRLPELIAILCQAWLLSSRAALIERRGRVIVGLAQHIAACRAMSLSQSSASGDGADVRFGQTRSFGDVRSMSALLESGRRSAQLRCRKVPIGHSAAPLQRRKHPSNMPLAQLSDAVSFDREPTWPRLLQLTLP